MTNEMPDEHPEPVPTGPFQPLPIPKDYIIVISSHGEEFQLKPDSRLDPNAVLRDLIDAMTQFIPTVGKYNEKRPSQVKEYIIEQIKKA